MNGRAASAGRGNVASAMPPQLLVATSSPDQTRAVAAALAACCRGGDLILLTGDLGAGKTTFTQGFGAALGVTSPITSPTFTLHHRYEGRLVVNHLDVYRLEQLDDTIELGLAELLDSGDVTVIEWGDMIRPALGSDYVQLTLELGEADDQRLVRIEFAGTAWADRFEELTEAVAALGGGPC
jgi:tRNA threonylcarbamoyladenosine biosynthesis protein TsaE